MNSACDFKDYGASGEISIRFDVCMAQHGECADLNMRGNMHSTWPSKSGF